MNADSAPRWPPTPRPSQLTWTVSPPKERHAATVHIHHRHFIITQPESWYSFYRPAEGGRLSQPRHCSKGVQPVPKAVYRSGCRDKHNRLRWDSNLGPLTPQSGMLPLGHCVTASIANGRIVCIAWRRRSLQSMPHTATWCVALPPNSHRFIRYDIRYWTQCDFR